MKRMIICAVLLGLAVTVSVYSYIRVERMSGELNMRIDALNEVLATGDGEEIVKQSAALSEYWDREENVLVHFVRHSYIDMITISATRLPPLAEHGEYSEVAAELASIRRQIGHLQNSEILSFKNLMS